MDETAPAGYNDGAWDEGDRLTPEDAIAVAIGMSITGYRTVLADVVLAGLRYAGYAVVRLSEDERDEIATALRSKALHLLKSNKDYADVLGFLSDRVQKEWLP